MKKEKAAQIGKDEVEKIPGVACSQGDTRIGISEYFLSGHMQKVELGEDAMGYLADMAIRVGDDAETLVDFTVGGVLQLSEQHPVQCIRCCLFYCK